MNKIHKQLYIILLLCSLIASSKAYAITGPTFLFADSVVDFGAISPESLTRPRFKFCISYEVDEENEQEVKWHNVYMKHLSQFGTALNAMPDNSNVQWQYRPLGVQNLDIPPVHKFEVTTTDLKLLGKTTDTAIPFAIAYYASEEQADRAQWGDAPSLANSNRVETRWSRARECAQYSVLEFRVTADALTNIPHDIYDQFITLKITDNAGNFITQTTVRIKLRIEPWIKLFSYIQKLHNLAILSPLFSNS